MVDDQNNVKKVTTEILNVNELWTDVFLIDGTRIRMKPVVKAAHRLVGVADSANPGKDAYALEFQMVFHTEFPE